MPFFKYRLIRLQLDPGFTAKQRIYFLYIFKPLKPDNFLGCGISMILPAEKAQTA